MAEGEREEKKGSEVLRSRSRESFLTDREKKSLAIIENLRFYGPLSKADIAINLGLNAVTTSNYINSLLERRLVVEKDLDVSQGGRRPVLLDLNPQAANFIGVGINLLDVVGALFDLKTNILTRTRKDKPPSSAREISDCILNIITEILKKNNGAREVKGIGIGIAGIVNKEDGSVRWPERIGSGYTYASVYLPLKKLIEKEFSLPVFVENDATAACFGEKSFGLDPEVRDVLYMFSGVGCGIIINGEIYRGSTGSAGEVAIHNQIEDEAFNCESGLPCYIKRWELDLGLGKQAREFLTENKDKSSRILELVSGDVERITVKEVFAAAKENDAVAENLLKSAARRLGVKIAFLVNLLNPEVVIIGGGIEEAGNFFLDEVRQAVRQWVFEDMFGPLKILYSALRENAVALGAAGLSMRHVLAKP